jgi:hypothetical protein
MTDFSNSFNIYCLRLRPKCTSASLPYVPLPRCRNDGAGREPRKGLKRKARKPTAGRLRNWSGKPAPPRSGGCAPLLNEQWLISNEQWTSHWRLRVGSASVLADEWVSRALPVAYARCPFRTKGRTWSELWVCMRGAHVNPLVKITFECFRTCRECHQFDCFTGKLHCDEVDGLTKRKGSCILLEVVYVKKSSSIKR